jgi:hypothetical protein
VLTRVSRIAVVVLIVGTLGGGVSSAGAARPGSDRPDRSGASDPDSRLTRGVGVLPNFAVRRSNVIRLAAGAFDPLRDALPSVPGIPLVSETALPSGQPQYWLLQVEDHRYPEVVRAVARAGGLMAGYAPDATYVVRATTAQRNLIAASPAVRWMGYYQPAWRIPPAVGGRTSLLDLTGRRIYRVSVFRAEPAPGAVGRALAAIPGVRVTADAGAVIDVESTPDRLPAIASISGVEWVNVRPTVVLHNANSRWVTDTGVRDVYAATAPGRLTGAGQTAAVADTAINYTYDLNGRAHVAFRDCDPDGTSCKKAVYEQVTPGTAPASLTTIRNNATGHRKMVAFFDLGDTGPNPYDESSHGSHTSGSVDGDRAPYGTWTGDDGMAPAAMHVHQNIGTAGGGLVIPDDLYQLFRQAYRPRDPSGVATTSGATGNPNDYRTEAAGGLYRPLEDARTHNNSWGSGILGLIPPPDAGIPVDQFVWDHEDMLIVFSAGNAGPEAGSLGSPALAKNDLTSGASANGRQPMVSIDSMAQFSSHGPSTDGRFGVDVATPGQVVVSVKGGSVDGYHVAQGTSMSAPVLTGLATLVRQYFADGYAAAGGDGFAAGSASASRSHNPSAALVRAAMANGAVRMRGWYTGDDGTVAALDGQWPSGGQGFGLVNLDNSLYFANDPTRNWYLDVYRGDTTGPPNTQSFPVSALPATRSHTVQVASGQPLDVTLAWTDAPNIAVAGSPALVNNLDLVVTGPGGRTYVGNNMNSRTDPGVETGETVNAPGPRDATNNTERIHVANPVAGTYTISVQAGPIATGRQGFALSASGAISGPGQSFSPGPGLQVDQPGSPAISNVRVETISSNTATLRFDTSEPTTATAEIGLSGGPHTFVDSYNIGSAADWPGLNPGAVETSAAYANRAVVGVSHEILLTGLSPGQSASATIAVRDLAGNSASQAASLTSPSTVFQADSPDIGQCAEGEDVCRWHDATFATQMYASNSGVGDGLLGAFMFRAPEDAVNPDDIVAATVELTSIHNWTNPYTSDPELFVDLLDSSVEAGWGTQSYDQIHGAPAGARVYPETAHRRGAYQSYAFTLRCDQLQTLKDTLAEVSSGERLAAFRYEATVDPVPGLFAMEFGFNRRSHGPAFRPKLVLFTAEQAGYPDGRACDPSTPAPAVSSIGIHDGVQDGSVTVSWETDVDSDSMVLFREQGTTEWIQVGTAALTRVHQVQVFGLDPSLDYEFVVRSSACNGATSTDTNGGRGYGFFHPGSDPGPPTVLATYDFEAGTEGWTTTGTPTWIQRAPGHESGTGWHISPYIDNMNATLVSPAGGVTFPGQTAAVEFFVAHDLEPTFDFLHVEHSTDGINWTSAAAIDGLSPDFPSFSPKQVLFSNPGGPVQVRLRLEADLLISSPVHLGVSVDKVSLVSYPDEVTASDLPGSGPAPPPSADATGLTAPPTRTGPASAADLASGTGACVIPGVEPSLPDLTLSPGDIAFSSQKIKGGDQVTITASIHNVGDAAASAVVVRFEDGGSPIGADQTISSIPAGGSGTASVVWDTKHLQGSRTITVTADPGDAIDEVAEGNNSASVQVNVRGNKVKNQSFEQSSDGGSSPDHWSSSGETSYAEGGSDGERSVTASPLGSWTSEGISVEPGGSYEVAVDAAGAGGALLVEQYSLTGTLLGTLTVVLSVADDGRFHTVTDVVSIDAGVAEVRLKLSGALLGVSSFDNVGLWEA